MLVSAIVAVAEPSSGVEGGEEHLPVMGATPSGGPLACAEILGQPVVERMIQRLQRSTVVKNISLVTPDGIPAPAKSALRRRITRLGGSRLVLEPMSRWALSDALKQQAQGGTDKLLLIRLGAYVEFDLDDLLQFHIESGGPVTRVHDHEGPLDMWMIDVGSACSSAGFGRLAIGDLGSGIPYLSKGYVNRLKDARDLRRLVVDAFLGRCAIAPGGRERKPGVWIEESARVHRSVRIVAPAYIGGATKVQASALITRFSSVEHHCEVGAGTAVKGSTILPYTRLGKSLCVARSLVDGNRLTHLGRNISVEVADPNLLRRTAPAEPAQTKVPLFAAWRMRASEAISGSLNFSEGEL